MNRKIFFAVVLMSPVLAAALGPHETLLLVNRESQDSVAVAKEFAALRRVPSSNIVELNIPGKSGEFPTIMSPEEFTALIWTPAINTMRARGVDSHILAWIYSVDFPTTIQTDPQISITGLTFLKNRLPDPDKTRKGLFLSHFFSDSEYPGSARKHMSQTFDTFKSWLGDETPIPAMMLGFTGTNGNSLQAVVDCLKKGKLSDGTAPTGTVYFITGEDVRATCRQWQFPEVKNELAGLGIRSLIQSGFPGDSHDILGLMMGSANVKPAQNTFYLPGSMAEHLTSMAAVFNSPDQTKISAWIQAGATASAGTVTEPYAQWTKFPHARFFVHYASGCTLIESMYLSIRCPLQILPVGDPLAQPWSPKGSILILGLENKPVKGIIEITSEVQSDVPLYFGNTVFFVDGKPAGRGNRLSIDTTALENGRHTLRAVARTSGLLRRQIFAEKEFAVDNVVE